MLYLKFVGKLVVDCLTELFLWAIYGSTSEALEARLVKVGVF